MIPPWGASPVKPRPSQALTAFYLHAGADGQADVKECLIQLTREFKINATLDFVIDLRMHVVDQLQGGSSLVLEAPGRRAALLSSLSSNAQLIFVTPLYRSFARARHCNPAGPRPLRDNTWPRGRPRLSTADQALVDVEISSQTLSWTSCSWQLKRISSLSL